LTDQKKKYQRKISANEKLPEFLFPSERLRLTIAVKFPTQNLLRKILKQGNFIDAIAHEFFRQFFKGGSSI